MKKLSICISFFLFLIFSTSASKDNLNDDYSEYNAEIYRKYINLDNQLKGIADKSVRMLLPYIMEAADNVTISATCSRNLFSLVMGLRKLTDWSFNFIDSMGKLQSGLQVGNTQMFGEYGECIDTVVMKKQKVDFRGKYCSIAVKPYLPKLKKLPGLNGRIEGLVNATKNSSGVMKLIVSRMQIFYGGEVRMGICVPTGCTKKDISEILNYSLGEYINTTVSFCLKKGDIYFWTRTRIIITSIFVCLGLIVIVSTYLDNTLESWKSKDLGSMSRTLQCFSLIRNFPKLMNTDVPDKSITCFHGIRVLTIFWIILGHEYFMHAIARTGNHMKNYEDMLNNFFSQIVLNGYMNVDMFFFMSGCVNSYTRMLMKQEGKSQPSFMKIIAHRLWRIYPAYITSFLLMGLMNKPQPYHYHLFEEFADNCDLYWWRNFLFINNYFSLYKMCMAQSWYLCVDMQLFLLTFLTLPFLLRKPKRGIILHIILIVIVNLCTMSWWLVHENVAPSTMDGTNLNREEAEKSFQINVLTPVHVGPYFIGIILGCILAKKKDIKISKIIQVFGWIVASVFFISMLFMTLIWNSGTPYTQVESSLYGAWSRTIMIVGFSWLVFCCVTGRATLFNYILSLRLWIPLSRLVYMIYLVSPIIQGHYGNHLNFPDDIEDMRIIWNFFADTSISILMSFVLVLLVESPLIAMEKIFFGGKAKNNKASFEVPKQLNFCGKKESEFYENGKFASIHL